MTDWSIPMGMLETGDCDGVAQWLEKEWERRILEKIKPLVAEVREEQEEMVIALKNTTKDDVLDCVLTTLREAEAMGVVATLPIDFDVDIGGKA